MTDIDEDAMYPGQKELLDAMASGSVTYHDYPPEEAARILDDVAAAAASTPENPDDLLVGTSLRLTYRTAQKVRTLAETRGVKPSVLLREFIEAQVAMAESDHLISYADALRVLSTLKSAA